MNAKKFFELAKTAGIEQSQLRISKSKSLSIKLFHNEIDNYTIADSQGIVACGIYKGRFGSARTQKFDKTTFPFLVEEIKLSALYNEKDEGADVFKGSEKYHKKNVFNAELASIPVDKKIATIREIEKQLFAKDKRITEVEEVDYKERESETEFYNSFGLKLKQKRNYFVVVAGAVAKQNEETKTAFEIFIDNDFNKFQIGDFVNKIASKVLAKFGGEPCLAGKYPTVLHGDVIDSLIGYFLSSVSSEEVQKKSSMLIGKLHTKVASSHVTIEERPLDKNVFFSYFDDEGVAQYNKFVVKKGVLETYFYNRETAKKDGVQSTGNGVLVGGKMGIANSAIAVKPGKKSFDELIAPIAEGVYITEIEGLGTGMNEVSGDFSCQAQGFMIEGGKLTKPLNLITLSGNLLKMLMDVKGFDNAVELKPDGTSIADVYIKKMSIGGK